MRDHDPARENQFYHILRHLLNLEHDTGRHYKSEEYSLSRMGEILQVAGNPQDRLRIVHVAGTKGKGTTCLYLASLMQAAGLRVGVFTSPHLATIRERFQMNGELISYEELLTCAESFLQELERRHIHPTFFEFITVLSLRIFARGNCEWVVLETGIGGLLDATNYVRNPVCAVITSISYDHTELLGPTIEDIAAQKAGIIKEGVPIVCARQVYPAAVEVIRVSAENKKAALHMVENAPNCDRNTWGLTRLPPFLMESFDNAWTVCNVLGIRPDPSRYRSPVLRARCECIHTDPLVVIDGAHNADSARRLVEAMHFLYPGESFTIVLGVVKGKDARGIFENLLHLSHTFILTNPHTMFKGSQLAELVALAREHDVEVCVQESISSLDDLPAREHLLFTGSFFTALLGEELFNRRANQRTV